MHCVSGTLVRATAVIGLPLARLRAAIPEEILGGRMSHVVGRRVMSAAWLKVRHPPYLARRAAQPLVADAYASALHTRPGARQRALRRCGVCVCLEARTCQWAD